MTEGTSGGPGAPRSRTEIRLTAAQKRTKAVQLRSLRWGYQDIADQVGYASRSAAHRAVEAGLKAIPYEAVQNLRHIELESLDTMERAILTKALKGDIGALRTLLHIKDTRAKLTGLYETPTDTGVEELRAALGDFMGLAVQAVKHQEATDD